MIKIRHLLPAGLLLTTVVISSFKGKGPGTAAIYPHSSATLPGDTIFPMIANAWTGYSYKINSLIDSGATKYFTTPEGVKAMGQGPRLGVRLQTKYEINFANKVVYFKWKISGDGKFVAAVPQLKYDPTTTDSNPAIMGVDLDNFYNSKPTGDIKQVMDDTWYYTRMSPIPGTDSYLVVTSINNYNNAGGSTISSKMVTLYTKSGYIGIRIGDPYGGTNASVTFGECKVMSN